MRTISSLKLNAFVSQHQLTRKGPDSSVMLLQIRKPSLGQNREVGFKASVPLVATRSSRQDDVDLLSTNRQPEDVRGAIAVGLDLYERAEYKEALEVFEKALKLPGTGPKRYRDKPRSISDGEKQSVLYNIACCYSRLEDARTGLVALAGCLEAGYEDAQQLRTDPDLEFLRKDKRFEGLIDRFKLSTRKGFFNDFLKGFNL